MHPDGVLIAETLPLNINGVHGNLRSIHRINAVFRRAGSVGSTSMKLYNFR